MAATATSRSVSWMAPRTSRGCVEDCPSEGSGSQESTRAHLRCWERRVGHMSVERRWPRGLPGYTGWIDGVWAYNIPDRCTAAPSTVMEKQQQDLIYLDSRRHVELDQDIGHSLLSPVDENKHTWLPLLVPDAISRPIEARNRGRRVKIRGRTLMAWVHAAIDDHFTPSPQRANRRRRGLAWYRRAKDRDYGRVRF
ncbi:hypothetical protein MRB53_038112 [Persea americana]|nr:hypothetical protein MRB53_038112 [Persea americana]